MDIVVFAQNNSHLKLILPFWLQSNLPIETSWVTLLGEHVLWDTSKSNMSLQNLKCMQVSYLAYGKQMRVSWSRLVSNNMLTQCVDSVTVCRFNHSVSIESQCVDSITVCRYNHSVSMQSQCVDRPTVRQMYLMVLGNLCCESFSFFCFIERKRERLSRHQYFSHQNEHQSHDLY